MAAPAVDRGQFRNDLQAWVDAAPAEQKGRLVAQERILSCWVYQEAIFLSLEKLGLTSLPDVIGQIGQLEQLWIRYNKLTTLPNTMGQLTNLKEIWACGNQIRSLSFFHRIVSSIKVFSFDS